jgi:hypothetical protein
LLTPLEGLPQPMIVFREIEFTGAARNRATVLDRAQELAVFERLQVGGTDVAEFIAARCQVVDQAVKATAIDARFTPKPLQSIELLVEFLVYVAADIPA